MNEHITTDVLVSLLQERLHECKYRPSQSARATHLWAACNQFLRDGKDGGTASASVPITVSREKATLG